MMFRKHLIWFCFIGVTGLMVCPVANAIDAAMPNPPASPTEVSVGVFVADIIDLDEVNENFQIEMILIAVWKDPRLAFDAEKEGTKEKIFQGPYQFAEVYTGWWPQLLILNEVGRGDFNAVKLTVYPDGTVRYAEQRNVLLETPMSLEDYPFDIQRLNAYIVPFGNRKEEVVLKINDGLSQATDEYVKRHSDVNIAEWDLRHLQMEEGETYYRYYGKKQEISQIKLTIVMQRQSAHVVWDIICPLFILVSMIWSIFWMDIESLADRLNISFIGILTIVAYQFLIIDNMPRISYLTFTDALLLLSFIIMSATIPESLYIHSLVRRGKQRKAQRIDRAARWAFPLVYIVVVGINYIVYIYLT